VTSANISGEASLSSAQEILDMFNGQIEMVVDGTANSSGVESTVLDCTGPVFKILRQGPLADRLKGYLKIGN
jgi:L-threonylcarbamoyladenylate synthase